MEIRIIYLTLFVLMFAGLYVGGKGIKKKDTALILVGILVFTLNEGLRFGRWIDYNNYYFFYQQALQLNQSRFTELFFVGICRTINALGGTYQVLILLMSFMHILGGVLFLRRYRSIAPYALPLYAFFSYSYAENLVRWYFGFSFVLIGLYYLFSEDEQKKKHNILLYLLFSIIGMNIHFGMFIIFPFFLIIIHFKKPLLPPVATVSIYVALVLFFRMEFMQPLIDVANLYGDILGGRFESYAENADRWLTAGALGLEKTNSYRGFLLTSIFIICVVVGYTIRPYFGTKYIYAYNSFIFGLLLNPIAERTEMLSRFDQLFILFVFVIIGYIIKYVLFEIIKINMYVRIFILIILIGHFAYTGYRSYSRKTDQLLYVWDKNGREYLDNMQVYFLDMYQKQYK